MEEYIRSNLQNNEKILWTGRPAGIKLLEAPYAIKVLGRWCIGIALLIFMAWYVGTDAAANQEPGFMVGFMALLGLAVVVAFGHPFFQKWKLENKCLYCVTNQRAIICIQGRKMHIKFKILDEVESFSVDELAGGRGTVYVGKKTRQASTWSREQSVIAEAPAYNHLPLMFHSIPGPEEALVHLRGQQNTVEHQAS